MNLGEMRTSLLANVFDDTGSYLTSTKANRYLNSAMRHIANLAANNDQALFVAQSGTVTLTASSTGYSGVYFYSGSSPTFALAATARFRRLIAVWNNSYNGGIHPLKIISFDERERYLASSQSDTPAVCVFGELLSFAKPNAITVFMDYIYALPDMTVDTDTPGQSGGSGTANALPTEYHDLLATYATILALSGEANDPSSWTAIYTEMRDELLQTLAQRRGIGTNK